MRAFRATRINDAVLWHVDVGASVGKRVMTLENPTGWRRLVGEYATLLQLADPLTPQARGQRFNSLIAELFTAFGINAKSNQNSVGELDVTFSHGGRRFILEAKWEKRKTATGPIAKLQRRVEQRMVGVTGVFLSMQGYSESALVEIDKGRRLDVLLLDQSHWEAMLSGFVQPPELLDLVTDAASYHGRAYTSLDALLAPEGSEPKVTFGCPPEISSRSFRPIVDNVRSEVVVAGIQSRRPGVASAGVGRLLITTDHGVMSLDLAKHQATWAVSATGCRDNPLPMPGNAILIQRAYGVGQYRDARLSAMLCGGSPSETSQLLSGPDGSAWRFAPKIADAKPGQPAALVKLNEAAGTQDEVPSLPATAAAAVWLNSTDLVVADESELRVLSTGFDVKRRTVFPGKLPVSMSVVDERRIVWLDANSTLWATDILNEQHTEIGSFSSIEALACCLDESKKLAYIAGRYRSQDAENRVAVFSVKATGSWFPRPSRRASTIARRQGAHKEHTSQNQLLPVRPELDQTDGSRATGSASSRDLTPEPSPARNDDARHVDQHRGYRDGADLATRLPLQVLERAIATNFDVARWLQPWRERWRQAVTENDDFALPEWLPLTARMLGSYAAPPDIIDSHFTPEPAYVTGFSDGMRASWKSAVQRGYVPSDTKALRDWLLQSVRDSTGGGTLRGQLTLRQLRSVSARNRMTAAWKRAGRVVLWLITIFFGIGTIAAIVITATGEWPQHTTLNTVAGNLFYEVPFLGLLSYLLFDIRKRTKRKRGN
ncbi:restriction endonuclease [Amycolatopsis taiwanensis]|uniref:Restriction endonuclease type IV Mrr domain-containing protein n=1 Tax=Amycolatopsis taiwanensis TaxID=342230 RepID=A0A9W6VEX0_9PSEU|nr:restriction endonuclease [Amycolatopsis taiwanensis]GLY68933.1 hypothetical protein Atai01_55520 [Amycolatopsis taiwanensis]